ncbi:MAG: biopolymer transporter ExbD [Sandaracinaceae bacterium]|nr:biopolymer transporter ExbD [Sandaracinaceae bacterium]
MAELTPLQRAYVRKRSKHHEVDPSEAAGELNIVPFLDIVMNMIMFLLATTQAVMAIAEIEAQLPTISRGGSGGGSPASSLNLSVTIVNDGVIVAGSGGKLAPGCASTRTGRVMTVPKVGGRYNWDALTECVARIKSDANFADEHQVTVSADPNVQYEHVIAALDALRSKGDDELFPDVMLSAGVR